MDREVLKHRVTGAVVLVSIAVIFLPMILDRTEPSLDLDTSPIPPAPQAKPFGEFTPEPPEWSGNPEHQLWTNLDSREPEPEGEPVQEIPDEKLPTRPNLTEEGLPEAWAVQLATFADEDNAKALNRKLLEAGFHAYLRETRTETRQLYRVLVGPELVASDARKVRDDLKKQFKLEGIVVRFKP